MNGGFRPKPNPNPFEDSDSDFRLKTAKDSVLMLNPKDSVNSNSYSNMYVHNQICNNYFCMWASVLEIFQIIKFRGRISFLGFRFFNEKKT